MADGPLPARDGAEPLEILREQRDALAQSLFESARQAAQLVIERQHLADALASAEARFAADATAAVEAARAACCEALAARDAALRARDDAVSARLEAEAALARVLSSTAWRMTAPVRHGLMLLLGRAR